MGAQICLVSSSTHSLSLPPLFVSLIHSFGSLTRQPARVSNKEPEYGPDLQLAAIVLLSKTALNNNLPSWRYTPTRTRVQSSPVQVANYK